VGAESKEGIEGNFNLMKNQNPDCEAAIFWLCIMHKIHFIVSANCQWRVQSRKNVAGEFSIMENTKSVREILAYPYSATVFAILLLGL